jgi:uridine phosphorylase
MASNPAVLRPHEPVAERVLLPGDPGRALRLAQLLIEGPKMLNHHRGLWGYSGPGADGSPLTIQSTGLGGPSAAAVVADLVALGARRLVRVGTAEAPAGGAAVGAVVIADAALARDGTSLALGAGDEVRADETLVAALRAAAGPGARSGLVASTDLLPKGGSEWADVEAVDLTTAAVLAAAAHHGAAAATVLAITGVLGDAARLGQEALEEVERELGRIGAAALG